MIMSGVPKPNRAGASETRLCATVDWSRTGIVQWDGPRRELIGLARRSPACSLQTGYRRWADSKDIAALYGPDASGATRSRPAAVSPYPRRFSCGARHTSCGRRSCGET